MVVHRYLDHEFLLQNKSQIEYKRTDHGGELACGELSHDFSHHITFLVLASLGI